MISVKYDGGLGNWLFQYCFGRILAVRLGYRLDAPGILGIPGTFDVVEGEDNSHREPRVLRGQKPDLSFLEGSARKHHLLLTGYFQRYEYYLPHRSQIRQWLAIPDHIPADISPSDVVLSIRRGRDYVPRYGLPFTYYEGALESLQYDRVFICTNEPDDPFVRHLAKKYSAVIRGGSFQGGKILPDYVAGALDNLLFIKKFNKIVLSNSSFPWWAAFLSDATEIIGPRPSSGMWAPNDPVSRNMNLEVPEPRYHFMDCEPYRSTFLQERLQNGLDSLRSHAKRGAVRLLPFLRRKRVASDRAIVFHEDGTRA